NYIAGNSIGTNGDDEDLGNAQGGIWIGQGFVDNDIGDWPGTPNAGNVIKYNGGPGVMVGQTFYTAEVPVQIRILTNTICDNDVAHEEQIDLVNGGNDDLPPPEVSRARNLVFPFSGEEVGRVSGTIGYAHPPDVATRIQVFYNTPEACGIFHGQVGVPGNESTWTVSADPLPIDAEVYATETTKGPELTFQPTMQTSPYSAMEEVDWWFKLSELCDPDPCGWEGTAEIGRMSCWVDYNDDGLLDLFICNAGSANLLCQNMEDYDFEAVDIGPLAAPQEETFSAAWADADNDGDFDCYLVNDGQENGLFRNDGGMGFTDVTPPVLADEGAGRTAAWADYDLDGDLDLFLTNYGQGGRLFRNDGGLIFSDVTEALGDPPLEPLFAAGVAWGDHDSDGDPDLYVVNGAGPNRLFRNDLESGFTDATTGPLGDPGIGRGVLWADFFHDDYLDLFVGNYDGSSKLLRNTGEGTFIDATPADIADIVYVTACGAEDVDLDGDLDLTVVTDSTTAPVPIVWLNDGEGQFAPAGVMPDGVGRSAAFGNIDGDGDLDLFLVGGQSGTEEVNSFLANTMPAGRHYLHVNLHGTSSNRFGVGARIEVVVGDRTAQMREVTAGAGAFGQGSITAEFGLGDADHVDMVRVAWPSGVVTELTGVEADQVITIEEDPVSDITGGAVQQPPLRLRCDPNPSFDATRVEFELRETSVVTVRVLDAAGRVVRTLANGRYPEGRHRLSWNGRNESGQGVGSGIYFLSLETGGHRIQQKLMRVE
ncbi:MAG: T9SS type A sorting domain-containing protein, partial [Candidatus Eisenbacteria bacterium]|nr:T9SS type A sorting domain-containing protein [Candidatus Eisenbacteria bacterium]